MKGGHLGKCKECTRTDVRRNRAAKLDYYRQQDRERGKHPHRKELVRRTRERLEAERPGYHAEQLRRTRAKYPLKYKARKALGNAIRDGRITRQPCERCGASQVHAHHDDYRKPLAVRWLCSRCHGAEHASRNESWRSALAGTILEHVTEHGPRPFAERQDDTELAA
jgi:ribosomal protein S27AE